MASGGSVCRICLSNDELQVSVYGTYARKHRILVKIRVCLPITIDESDAHSKTICYNCIAQLDRYYDYYCNSLTTQRVLENGDSTYKEYFRKKVDQRFTAAVVQQARRHDGESRVVPAITDGPSSSRFSDLRDAPNALLTQSPRSPRMVAVSNATYVVGQISPHPPLPSVSFLDLGMSHKKKKKKELMPRNVYATYDARLPRISPALFDDNISDVQ